MTQFHILGPVPLGPLAYIQRGFEERVFQEIVANHWILLLGPRQHGKTSALLRIKSRLSEAGILTVYLDIQKLPPVTEFGLILEWISDRVAREIGVGDYTKPSGLRASELMAWLESVIPAGNSPLVLIVDEAAGIYDKAWRNSLYGQIRSIANDRAQANSTAGRLRFIFAGTFRPETLVDQLNSPFNVCQPIETGDLTLDQVHDLTQQVDADLLPYAEQAYQVVNGQPYLLQVILTAVAQAAPVDRPQAYADIVAHLRLGGDAHFEGIFSKVFADANLVSIVSRITRNGNATYEPANSDFKFLQVLGIAKRSGNQLIFRNNLYAEMANASPQLLPGAPTGAQFARLFTPPEDSYAFMRDIRLREIVKSAYAGAVQAYNAGSHRLSLVGFGCALEGLLLDWLLVLSPTDLAAKVRDGGHRVRFDTRFERAGDPLTWRFENLIEVARAGSAAVQIVDPPDSLRRWRNLAHPSNARMNYRTEIQLEPEARQASGMFAAMIRDLSHAYP